MSGRVSFTREFRQALGRIERKLDCLLEKEGRFMSNIDDAISDLAGQVAANTSAEQSATQVIQGLADHLLEIINSGGNSAQQVAAIEATAQQLKASAQLLGQAIMAGTAAEGASQPALPNPPAPGRPSPQPTQPPQNQPAQNTQAPATTPDAAASPPTAPPQETTDVGGSPPMMGRRRP